MKTKSGFTLMELLVVIAVVGILAIIVISQIGKARTKAQEKAFLAEARTFAIEAEFYYLDNQGYAPASIIGECPVSGSEEWGFFATEKGMQLITSLKGQLGVTTGNCAVSANTWAIAFDYHNANLFAQNPLSLTKEVFAQEKVGSICFDSLNNVRISRSFPLDSSGENRVESTGNIHTLVNGDFMCA